MLFPDGKAVAPRVTSPFGPRPGFGAFNFHYGADMVGFQVIRAVADGRVTFAGRLNNAAGNTVIIDHGGGVTSLYMHNLSNMARKGEYVKMGTPIAILGMTGNATGPCCHLEIRVHGTSVEPVAYINARITREEDEEMASYDTRPVMVELDTGVTVVINADEGSYWVTNNQTQNNFLINAGLVQTRPGKQAGAIVYKMRQLNAGL